MEGLGYTGVETAIYHHTDTGFFDTNYNIVALSLSRIVRVRALVFGSAGVDQMLMIQRDDMISPA